MPPKTYTTTILADPDGSVMTALPVPFDPKEVFGKVRAPVTVTLNGYTYRTTICIMKGEIFVPLRTSNREAAGVKAGQKVKVTLTLDEAPRTVTPPPDLARALRAAGLTATWKTLAFTHQREHAEAIESAKKPETRAKRIAACIAMVKTKANKPARKAAPK